MDCSWVGWCALRPEAQAAWLQAIGSIAAIIAAAAVPWKIARNQVQKSAREDLFRAKSLAFVLLPVLKNLRGRLSSSRARWRQFPVPYDDDAVLEGLEIPQSLSERLTELHSIEDAGDAIRFAINSVEEVRNSVWEAYAYLRYGGVLVDYDTGEEFPLSEPEDVDGVFDSAAARIDAAVRELEQILSFQK